jgi:DNA polymerase-1
MQNAAWIERMMWRGMPIDENVRLDRLATAVQSSQEAREVIPVANPGSTKQVAAWLYDELQLPILKLTPAGKPSTDEDTINRLALLGHEAPKQVLTYRGHEKNRTTYIEPMGDMTARSFDGRLHPDIRMAVVETGRHSSFMHTVPRDSLIRSILRSTDPNWELVEVDQAQLEARLAAWAAAGRPRSFENVDWSKARMLHAFLEGRDLYREMAGAGLGKDWRDVTTKERQDMGKVPVLAMLYKISWRGLREYAWRSNQLDWSEAFAKHLWSTFNNLFPEFRKWHQSESEKILARGWARTELGRIRHLPDAFSPIEQVREAAVRSGINMPIQGLGSDITQAAGILLDLRLDPEEAFIIHEIHDALLLAVRKDQVASLTPILKHYMEKAHLSLRPLGLHLPDGLLIAEEKIGPWGMGVSLEKYQTSGAAVLGLV